MRISDWSSDPASRCLLPIAARQGGSYALRRPANDQNDAPSVNTTVGSYSVSIAFTPVFWTSVSIYCADRVSGPAAKDAPTDQSTYWPSGETRPSEPSL